MSKNRTLLWLNLKTDALDSVLGFTTDWINAFAQHFAKVIVVTHMAGAIQVADNVVVYSVGKEKGFSEPRRVLQFYRLLKKIFREHHVDACFSHMNPKFSLLAWPVTWWNSTPQILWYAHKATPIHLHLAHSLVDLVVTSTPAGFRLKSSKAHVISQGITEEKFPFRESFDVQEPWQIISVARISRIKNIRLMAEALLHLRKKMGCNPALLTILGAPLSADDKAYKDEIIAFLKEHSLGNSVHFAGAVPHGEIPCYLRSSDVSLNLAPKGAIDKAALESLAMGVPAIVWNESFAPVFESANIDPNRFIIPDLSAELLADRLIDVLSTPPDVTARLKLAQAVVTNHGIRQLAQRVTQLIENTCFS